MGEEGAYRYCDDDATTTIGSSLIPIINKLHDILAPVGGELKKISLPQVAVVGSQSSGKSSVLEALVGLDFLPRGTEICTRRPLALMLENRPYDNADGAAEWGEFRHLPGKRFYDFSKIRQEIQAETEKAAGSNKGVSDKQIGLKISSPNVLNMTLIDLPGITKVPVGDQPSDIEARIRRIIMAYISQQNSIILAVTPANSDLTNSDALQMAREADPTGSRTIGVITKLDIMDRGTNACNFLLGKVVPLRLGYIGVINRSQEDIDSNRTIQEALAREERFFSDHPVYNSLSDRCGIPQLAKRLNQILEQHIKTALPNLKADLNSRMVAVVKELQTYGEVAQSKAEQGMILLKSLTRYHEAFMAMVNGESQEMSTKELSGGARIHYIFQSIFVKSLEVVNPCEDLTDDDIRTAIQNANGPTNALFVPEVPFGVLVRRQIMRLLDPSLQCLIYVYDELIKMSCACVSPELQRFPNLSKRLLEVVGKFLRDGLRHTEGVIANLIDMEMDYINSSHPNFIGGKIAVEQAMEQFRSSQGIGDFEKKPPNEDQRHRATIAKSLVKGVASNQGIHCQLDNERPVSTGSNLSTRNWGISSLFGSRASSMENPRSRSVIETLNDAEQSSSVILLREPPSVIRPVEMTEREAVEIIVTKSLLQSYYDIVRKNIQDLVPKAIMHFLVNHAKRNLHDTFIQKLYRENLFEELLQEQGEVVAKRKHAREIFHVLLQAVQALDEIDSDVSSRCSNSSSALGGGTATTVLSSSAGGSLHLHSGRVVGNSLPYLSSTQKAKALGLYYSDEKSAAAFQRFKFT